MDTLRVLRNTNLCQAGEILLVEEKGGETYRCFRTRYDAANNKMVKRGKPFIVPAIAFSAPEQPVEIDHADDEEIASAEDSLLEEMILTDRAPKTGEQPKAEGTAAEQL